MCGGMGHDDELRALLHRLVLVRENSPSEGRKMVGGADNFHSSAQFVIAYCAT